jgi:gas vesicle protein
MADTDTKKFLFVGSIIGGVLGTVITIYNLVYSPLDGKLSAEQITRAEEDKAVRIEVAKGDDCTREDFLEAIEKLTDEQKKDNKEISEKLGALAIDMAVVKKEIQDIPDAR